MTPKTGIGKARKTAKEIKSKIVSERSERKVEEEALETALAKVQKTPGLAKMYRDNASLGSENLSGSLPLLKIHAVGKSLSNQLDDGTEPNDGWFFYSQDGSQYEQVVCHILSISKSFRAPGIGSKSNEQVFNQMMGGVIVNNGDLKPFIMYLTGLRLAPMWEFGKEVGKYTKRKELPIPLFAFKVMLTTNQEKHQYGQSWAIKFEVVKDEDGVPEVVTDEGLFVFLRDNVSTIQGTMEKIITSRSGESSYDETPHPAEEVTSGDIDKIDKGLDN